MGKPTTIEPHYNLTHANMIGAVKTIFDLFVLDKPDFVIYDLDFDDPFESNWQNDIDTAENFDSDETVLDQQRQLTEAVEQKMDECRHKYQDSKRFIEKAFSDNKAVLDEFGYDNYLKVRNKQLEMILFMKLFHNAADKYKVQLIAKNYTQAMIDEILSLHDELDAANRAQEAFIKNRKTITHDRQIAYNKIWDTMVDVCKSGQSIYHDNIAKYEQYLLPSSGGSGTPTPVVAAIVTEMDMTVPKQAGFDFIGAAGKAANINWGDGNNTPFNFTGGVQNFTNVYIAGIFEARVTGDISFLSEMRIIDSNAISTSIPAVVNLRALTANDNRYISFALLPEHTNMKFLFLHNNALDQTSVNNILIKLNDNGLTNGQVNLGGGTNAAPTGLGLAAKNALIAKGWTVITN